MDGTQVRASDRLAVVVRSFLGSRLERRLLARVFALAAGGVAARQSATTAAGGSAAGTAAQRKERES